jgi:ketosteroid isomerase-like protein
MERSAEREVIDVLHGFCAGFADRDADTVMRLVGSGVDLVVVTSEHSVIRGPGELRDFLDKYIDGPNTYSWEWARYDVSVTEPVAWILAEGTETTSSGDRVARHPYRMTMLLQQSHGEWVVRQVHGSIPH